MPTVLLTGAAGFIGRAVRRHLCAAGVGCVGIDQSQNSSGNDATYRSASDPIVSCDVTDADSLNSLFASYKFDTIIHLAAVLPGAAAKDPIRATQVNVGGSLALLERAITHAVPRFIFGSSTSVYGTAGTAAPISEQVGAAPADVYGGAKRAIEIVGDNLHRNGNIQFVALRIATVIGPGARNTSSLWRSDIFEKLGSRDRISLPYDSDDPLTVVHVDDVARMLTMLAAVKSPQHTAYNTPAEMLTAGELKRTIESLAPETQIELTGRTRPLASLSDGSRFMREFGFQITPLQQSLRAELLRRCNQI